MVLPLLPIRSCENNIGPLEDIFTPIAVKIYIGSNIIIANIEQKHQ